MGSYSSKQEGCDIDSALIIIEDNKGVFREFTVGKLMSTLKKTQVDSTVSKMIDDLRFGRIGSIKDITIRGPNCPYVRDPNNVDAILKYIKKYYLHFGDKPTGNTYECTPEIFNSQELFDTVLAIMNALNRKKKEIQITYDLTEYGKSIGYSIKNSIYLASDWEVQRVDRTGLTYKGPAETLSFFKDEFVNPALKDAVERGYIMKGYSVDISEHIPHGVNYDV